MSEDKELKVIKEMLQRLEGMVISIDAGDEFTIRQSRMRKCIEVIWAKLRTMHERKG